MEWLVHEDQSILSVVDFACLASKEELVAVNIIGSAKATVSKVASVGESVKITKAWRTCRAAMDASDSQKNDPAETRLEAPMDDGTKASVLEAWVKKHSFVLPDAKLLVETLQGAVHRAVTAKKPIFPLYFLENLRCMASLEKKCHVSMVVQPGLHVRSEGAIADAVHGSLEVFLRGRAMIYTVAYVSIHRPAWFSLQDAEYFSQKLLAFTNQENDGARPSLDYLIKAWATTMQRFSESVRVNEISLSEVVRKSDWELLWTMWTPPAAANHGGNVQAQVGDNGDLARECDRLRTLAKTLQSEKDRMISKGSVGNGGKGSGGAGNGGKNGNGGKGGAKNDNKRQFEDVRRNDFAARNGKGNNRRRKTH
jgi:hypothetical protein